MGISVKENAELRHVFAHLQYAIDFLIEGVECLSKNDLEGAAQRAKGANYEMRSIEGLYMWDDDEQFLKEVSKHGMSKEEKEL